MDAIDPSEEQINNAKSKINNVNFFISFFINNLISFFCFSFEFVKLLND